MLCRRRESARKNALKLMMMCGGAISTHVMQAICGTRAYMDQVMMDLKKRGEAEFVYGVKPHLIRILRPGMNEVMDELGLILATEADERELLTIRKDRCERHAIISQTAYNAQLIGLKMYPCEKPFLYHNGKIDASGDEYIYYAPIEVKLGDPHELRGSRLSGIIIGKNRVLVLYNASHRNMKYYSKVEGHARQYITQKLCDRYSTKVETVFFCDNLEELALNIINNLGIVEKAKNYKYEIALATIKDVNHIIPNGENGAVLLKIMLWEKYADLIKKMAEKDRQGVIYNALLSNPRVIEAVSKEATKATVVCTKNQCSMFKMLTTDKEYIKLITYDDKKIEEWMKRQEKG